jgi:anti-anti-sigma factor
VNHTIDKKEKFTIIHLKEEKLLSTNAPELKALVLSLESEGVRNVILDLSETKYVDSSGLSAILLAHKTCKKNGGVMVLATLHDMVKNLLRISQLNSILVATATLDEAKDYIMMEELEKDIRG